MMLVPLDKYGWPVERLRNRPIVNAIRLLLHTRKIVSAAEWRRRETAIHSVLTREGNASAPCMEAQPPLSPSFRDEGG